MKITFSKKSAVLLMLFFLVTVLTIGCNNTSSEQPQEKEQESSEVIDISQLENKLVQIEMEDGGIMVFEMYPQLAPKTVQNFINLVEEGFYDGLTFHRILNNYLIQGGDPKGDGTGGSKERIEGEFSSNGFTQNTLKHTRGVISMARSMHANSATSQFFIMHNEVSQLDNEYAAFGKLIQGEDTLDKIAATPVKYSQGLQETSSPRERVVMKKVTVIEKESE